MLQARACNITTDNNLWYICGYLNNGGGVIDWAYDENDARERAHMWVKEGATNVTYPKYQ